MEYMENFEIVNNLARETRQRVIDQLKKVLAQHGNRYDFGNIKVAYCISVPDFIHIAESIEMDDCGNITINYHDSCYKNGVDSIDKVLYLEQIVQMIKHIEL